MEHVNIRGIQRTSLIDFPQVISTILFTGGCNCRCLYCHNPSLACNDYSLTQYSNEEVIQLLLKRKHLVSGVVLTGGEPTLAKSIVVFLQRIKELGFKIKLDTNGFQPHVLEALVSKELLDYVAIDIKTSPQKYPLLTKAHLPFSLIQDSIALLKKNKICFELRTTCVPNYVTIDDFHSIKEHVGTVPCYSLQQFCNIKTLDDSLQILTPYPKEALYTFRNFVLTFADMCTIKGI